MPKKQLMLMQDLERQEIFFYYKGPISQNTVKDIVSILKQKLGLQHASGTIVRQILPMIVENAQNIMHYSAEIGSEADSEKELRCGSIAVGYADDRYFVISSNLIEHHKALELRTKLETLQQMSDPELKQYYHEQSRKRRPDEKGAGLGFLEMVKNVSQPIEFDFAQIDAHLSFFTLKTVV